MDGDFMDQKNDIITNKDYKEMESSLDVVNYGCSEMNSAEIFYQQVKYAEDCKLNFSGDDSGIDEVEVLNNCNYENNDGDACISEKIILNNAIVQNETAEANVAVSDNSSITTCIPECELVIDCNVHNSTRVSITQILSTSVTTEQSKKESNPIFIDRMTPQTHTATVLSDSHKSQSVEFMSEQCDVNVNTSTDCLDVIVEQNDSMQENKPSAVANNYLLENLSNIEIITRVTNKNGDKNEVIIEKSATLGATEFGIEFLKMLGSLTKSADTILQPKENENGVLLTAKSVAEDVNSPTVEDPETFVLLDRTLSPYEFNHSGSNVFVANESNSATLERGSKINRESTASTSKYHQSDTQRTSKLIGDRDPLTEDSTFQPTSMSEQMSESAPAASDSTQTDPSSESIVVFDAEMKKKSRNTAKSVKSHDSTKTFTSHKNSQEEEEKSAKSGCCKRSAPKKKKKTTKKQFEYDAEFDSDQESISSSIMSDDTPLQVGGFVDVEIVNSGGSSYDTVKHLNIHSGVSFVNNDSADFRFINNSCQVNAHNIGNSTCSNTTSTASGIASPTTEVRFMNNTPSCSSNFTGPNLTQSNSNKKINFANSDFLNEDVAFVEDIIEDEPDTPSISLIPSLNLHIIKDDNGSIANYRITSPKHVADDLPSSSKDILAMMACDSHTPQFKLESLQLNGPYNPDCMLCTVEQRTGLKVDNVTSSFSNCNTESQVNSSEMISTSDQNNCCRGRKLINSNAPVTMGESDVNNTDVSKASAEVTESGSITVDLHESTASTSISSEKQDYCQTCHQKLCENSQSICTSCQEKQKNIVNRKSSVIRSSGTIYQTQPRKTSEKVYTFSSVDGDNTKVSDSNSDISQIKSGAYAGMQKKPKERIFPKYCPYLDNCANSFIWYSLQPLILEKPKDPTKRKLQDQLRNRHNCSLLFSRKRQRSEALERTIESQRRRLAAIARKNHLRKQTPDSDSTADFFVLPDSKSGSDQTQIKNRGNWNLHNEKQELTMPESSAVPVHELVNNKNMASNSILEIPESAFLNQNCNAEFVKPISKTTSCTFFLSQPILPTTESLSNEALLYTIQDSYLFLSKAAMTVSKGDWLYSPITRSATNNPLSTIQSETETTTMNRTLDHMNYAYVNTLTASVGSELIVDNAPWEPVETLVTLG